MGEERLSDREKAQLDYWLTEFRAMREEILTRLRLAQTLIGLNIAAALAIWGVAFSGEQYPNLRILYIVPFGSCIIGLLFLHFHDMIQKAGTYIKNVVTPAIQNLTATQNLKGWEDFHRNKGVGKQRRTEISGWVFLLLFAGPSTLSLAAFKVLDQLIPSFWVSGAVFTAAFILFWIMFWPYWRDYGKRERIVDR